MTRQGRGFSEQGGVSIFIVIFTALMVTVVAASFTQIMIRTQQQASTNDLSQSAYDSAMAGVEDAKRALIALRDCENEGGDCNSLRNALRSQSCESLESASVVEFDDNGEVQVGDQELNQAYTCVKVELETDSYVDEMVSTDAPVVIPLRSNSSYDQIRISWFNRDDFDDIVEANQHLSLGNSPEFPSFPTLPTVGEWPTTSPALMRAQLIQFSGSINLDAFNAKGTPNARTLFLYPSQSGSSSLSFNRDFRRNPDVSRNSPAEVRCNNFGYSDSFACQATITLPALANREAYLQLQTYYQDYTSYKVEMLNGGVPVRFDSVQPRVDSTGRASDLFRRVRAHISLRNDGVPLQYPDAALSVEGDLCKNFFITDDPDEYNYRSDAGC